MTHSGREAQTPRNREGFRYMSVHVWEIQHGGGGDEAGKTSPRLISVPKGSSGHDAHDPCWR